MGKNTNFQWDVIVIGAGASGMMSAITAARNGKKVIILEQLDKAGKKLNATGNGKCNFTNAVLNENCFGGDEAFIKQMLQSFDTNDCLDFFRSIGIYPKSKNGYYYPYSEQAASVVNAFLLELERLGVKISFETKVSKIESSHNGILVHTNKDTFFGKKTIVATGLKAAPKLGSDGSLLQELKAIGHSFSPILPALCGFYCKGIPFNKVSGVRIQGKVSAIVNNECVAEDLGEIQFNDYGLSGIPIFQISRVLSKSLDKSLPTFICLNFFPELTKEELFNELLFRKELCKNQTLDTLLNGFINQKLSNVILSKANLDINMFASSLIESDLQTLVELLQNLSVKVTKARDYEFAQICTGGIPVTEINWTTLESKIVPNMYFTGEIIDVDGICGGYNLHFAWATGALAGNSV